MNQILCPECNKPIENICYDCGCFYDKPELIISDLYNYQARPIRLYNRLDHFKEVIGQFQGKEGKHIPIKIIELIKSQIPEPNKATEHDLKKVMRKLKLTKYMENFNYIMFCVSGQNPPYIRREIEDKLIRMFKQINRIYDTINCYQRKSFLNYYYIIFKLLEMMKETELLNKIPIIRTFIRLQQHDEIWKQICNELGWIFLITDIHVIKSYDRQQQRANQKKNKQIQS